MNPVMGWASEGNPCQSIPPGDHERAVVATSLWADVYQRISWIPLGQTGRADVFADTKLLAERLLDKEETQAWASWEALAEESFFDFIEGKVSLGEFRGALENLELKLRGIVIGLLMRCHRCKSWWVLDRKSGESRVLMCDACRKAIQ